MAANPPADLVLTPLKGRGFPLSAWLVQYQLLLVALDPFTNEAAWILPTAARVLEHFDQANCRVVFVVAGADAGEAKQFLGPNAKKFLTFPDPDRSIVRSFGFERLPAIVHIASDASIVNSAEGWNPKTWQTVTDAVAEMLQWSSPVLPYPGDPGAFAGTLARG